MVDLPSLISDKDKLFVVANIYVDEHKQKGIELMNNLKNYFTEHLDNSVKFFVYPVLDPNLQRLEILNPKFVDDKTINELKENYQKVIELLEKKS